MNLLISFRSIFQDKESSGQEEDIEVAGREESSDGGQEGSEEEGHEEGAGLDDEGVGVTGLLQDSHPRTNLRGATSFALL
jgi:hypothetical protein